MNKILKEFYHGNLIPAERQMVKGSKLSRIVKNLTEAEDRLSQALPSEFLPLLKQFTDAQVTLNALTAETYYIDGFKTGARFMLAVQDDTCENLEPVKA